MKCRTCEVKENFLLCAAGAVAPYNRLHVIIWCHVCQNMASVSHLYQP